MSNLSLGTYTALAAEISAKASRVASDGARTAEAGACGYVAPRIAEKFCGEVEGILALIRRLANETPPLAETPRTRRDFVAQSIERSGR